jgi:DNA-3-methyladenine glycosylase
MLPKEFYSTGDVLEISKNLLGKKLCSTIGDGYTSGIIVETEAYRGSDDKACHAFGGKKTPRAITMYKQGGFAYVYMCYGIHPLFNIVTGREDEAEVVLIRAIEPLDGIEFMQKRRNQLKDKVLCSGPGKLTQAMGITKKQNEISLFDESSNLWLEDYLDPSDFEIISGPRVGLSTAEECMNWPWRFRIKDNQFSSKPNRVFYEGYPG